MTPGYGEHALCSLRGPHARHVRQGHGQDHRHPLQQQAVMMLSSHKQ